MYHVCKTIDTIYVHVTGVHVVRAGKIDLPLQKARDLPSKSNLKLDSSQSCSDVSSVSFKKLYVIFRSINLSC